MGGRGGFKHAPLKHSDLSPPHSLGPLQIPHPLKINGIPCSAPNTTHPSPTHGQQHILSTEGGHDDVSATQQGDGVHRKHVHQVEQGSKVAPHVTTMQPHLCRGGGGGGAWVNRCQVARSQVCMHAGNEHCSIYVCMRSASTHIMPTGEVQTCMYTDAVEYALEAHT